MLLWPFRISLWTAIRQLGWGGLSRIGLIWLCLLTIAECGANDLSQMSRPVRVALVLLAVFSITYVLATPDPTDDVTGVLRPSHLGKVQKLAVYVVHPLAPQVRHI